MKHLIIIILLIFFSLSIISAQDLVNPHNPPIKLSEKKGYMTINEFTGGFGLGDRSDPYSKSFFGLTTVNGYQINKNFVLGGGTGVLFYNGGTLIPLFIDLRFSFRTGAFRPYLFGDGGVLFNSGFLKLLINPGAGFRYSLNSHLAITLGAGVMVQSDSNRDSFVNLKLGLVFKPK